MPRLGQTNDWDNDNWDSGNNDQNLGDKLQHSQEAARLAAFGGMDRVQSDGEAIEFLDDDNTSNTTNNVIDDEDEVFMESRRQFMGRVYNWMFGGLALTAAAAWFVSHSQEALQLLMPIMGQLLFVPLVLVIVMNLCMNKMSAAVMRFCFILYAAVTGITFAPICLAYKISSLASAFAVTSAMFAALSLYGHFTRRNLSGLGAFCLMGLVGVLLGSIINLFLGNPMVDFIVTCSGIIVFAGLTAYDTKKLKTIHKNLYAHGGNDEKTQKMAIRGALILYLDFINLFLKLLSRRRR